MASYDGAPSLPASVSAAAEQANVQEVLDTLGADVAAMLRTALAGENPTQAQRDRANAAIGRKCDEKINSAKEIAKRKLKILPTDSPAAIRAKSRIASSFMDYLDKLCRWVIGKVSSIINRISQGITWCVTTAKSFFQGLWSWISGR